MSDIVVDLASLSEEVREKLAELDLELSEGEFVLGERTDGQHSVIGTDERRPTGLIVVIIGCAHEKCRSSSNPYIRNNTTRTHTYAHTDETTIQ